MSYEGDPSSRPSPYSSEQESRPRQQKRVTLDELLAIEQPKNNPKTSHFEMSEDGELENLPQSVGELLNLKDKDYKDLTNPQRALLEFHRMYEDENNREIRVILYRAYSMVAAGLLVTIFSPDGHAIIPPENLTTVSATMLVTFAHLLGWAQLEMMNDNWGPKVPSFFEKVFHPNFGEVKKRNLDYLEDEAKHMHLDKAYDYSLDQVIKEIRRQLSSKLRKQAQKKER